MLSCGTLFKSKSEPPAPAQMFFFNEKRACSALASFEQAEAEMRRQAEAQQRARAQRSPFFTNPFFAPRQRTPRGSREPRKYNDMGGPVIDVDYETIDDK